MLLCVFGIGFEEDSDYGVGDDDSESESDDYLGSGDSGQDSGEDE